MTDIHQVTALPLLECSGVANFSRLFQVLRQRIDQDVSALSARGRAVLRVVAFLLTNGQPTDENGRVTQSWRAEYERLTDKSWRRHPNVVPFVFGDATDMLQDMAKITGSVFLVWDPSKPESLRKIFAMLLNTLVNSAYENELNVFTLDVIE